MEGTGTSGSTERLDFLDHVGIFLIIRKCVRGSPWFSRGHEIG